MCVWVCVWCSSGLQSRGRGGAVGRGLRGVSAITVLTQHFPASGSSSGLGGASLRVSPRSECARDWLLALGSLLDP